MILMTVTFSTKEDFLKVAKARKDVRITDISCCDPPRLEFGAQPTLGELMAENTFGEDVDMYDFDIDPDDAEAFLGLEEVNVDEGWVSVFGPQTTPTLDEITNIVADLPTIGIINPETGRTVLPAEEDDGDEDFEDEK